MRANKFDQVFFNFALKNVSLIKTENIFNKEQEEQELMGATKNPTWDARSYLKICRLLTEFQGLLLTLTGCEVMGKQVAMLQLIIFTSSFGFFLILCLCINSERFSFCFSLKKKYIYIYLNIKEKKFYYNPKKHSSVNEKELRSEIFTQHTCLLVCEKL